MGFHSGLEKIVVLRSLEIFSVSTGSRWSSVSAVVLVGLILLESDEAKFQMCCLDH